MPWARSSLATWSARTAYRRLLLISRSGPRAESGIATELAELGAEVTIAACDAADRQSLEYLLGSLPEEHPLRNGGALRRDTGRRHRDGAQP
ncbi:KR domain-containing protein [Streptomyces himastatinicus]|uniref:KR domain-containing protein n=1 Tax=Streptomyces himastatinicus TaxID=998084 RepID=UPI003CCB0CAB